MTTTLDIINSAKDLDPAEYRAFFFKAKHPCFTICDFLSRLSSHPC